MLIYVDVASLYSLRSCSQIKLCLKLMPIAYIMKLLTILSPVMVYVVKGHQYSAYTVQVPYAGASITEMESETDLDSDKF
jgi:hypothetical protein